MRRDHRTRPDLGLLEGRTLPATLVAYPDAGREAIHAAYVAQASQSTSNLAFFGDSITRLWTGPGAATWSADFGPRKAADYGVVGDTTADLMARLEGGELAGRPKVAVVLIGINDLLGGESPAQAAAGVVGDVAAIRAISPGTNVVVLGVLPTADLALNVEIADTNGLIASVGGVPGVQYIDPGQTLLAPGGGLRPGVIGSGVHPSAAGYARIAPGVEAAVAGVLGPVRPATHGAASRAAAEASTPAIDPAGVLIPIDPPAPVATHHAAAAHRSAAIAHRSPVVAPAL